MKTFTAVVLLIACLIVLAPRNLVACPLGVGLGAAYDPAPVVGVQSYSSFSSYGGGVGVPLATYSAGVGANVQVNNFAITRGRFRGGFYGGVGAGVGVVNPGVNVQINNNFRRRGFFHRF